MKTRKIVSFVLVIIGIVIIIFGIFNLLILNNFNKDYWGSIALIPIGIVLIYSGYLVIKGKETQLAKAFGY